IGLAYKHHVDLPFEGDFRLGLGDVTSGDTGRAATLSFPDTVHGKARIRMATPASLRLGVSWAPLDWFVVHVAAAWVRSSVVGGRPLVLESEGLALATSSSPASWSIDLPRAWEDRGEVDALVGFKLGELVRLGARIGYRSPAASSGSAHAATVDGHRVVAAAMGRFYLSSSVALMAQLTAEHAVSPTIINSPHDVANGRATWLQLGAAVSLAAKF
ncbi:MAG: hypothetical protein QF464_20525, partial [Myxococcota bacterium]|nr:hypothetical protein [Myxococcota bacterium]